MTIDFRRTTHLFNSLAKSNMSDVQEKLFKLSEQVEVGKITSYQDLSSKIPIDNLLSMKDVQISLNGKIKNNELLDTKLREIDRVLRSMLEDVMRDSQKLSMEANNPGIIQYLPVQALAESQLSKIQSLLNSSFDGQKLFAGAKTNVSLTVSDIVHNTNIVNNVPTANYYNGDEVVLTDSISTTENIAYGIKASDPAFQNFIAAHHFMIIGDYINASSYLQIAKDQLSDLLIQVGVQSKSIEDQIHIDEKATLLLMKNISDAEDVDITLVFPQITQLESQLRAAFMLTNRLSELSLVNYLK
ncbi:MAG: flgL [Candidatus Midichloriaceae bacterium]|jgi:flagellin-like hook-associated protein FlgL|nr:flgL [Candidatus Midichloriaceae bacterium]